MSEQVASVHVAVGADLTKLSTGMNQTRAIVGQVSSGMGQLTTMIMGPAGLAIATIYLGKRAIGAALELGELGAEGIRTTNTFVSLIGNTHEATAALEGLRKATKGGVSDHVLMAASSKFLSMHLAQNAAEAEHLAHVSTQLGMAMNMAGGPTKAMESFALMLANKSIRRLDEFGISADRVKQRLSDMGSSVANDADFMSAVMAEAAVTMERVGEQSATAAEKQETAWANLRMEMGRVVAETDAYKGGMETVTGVTEVFTDVIRRAGQSAPLIGMYVSALERAFEAEQVTGLEAAILSQELARLDRQWQSGIINTEIFTHCAGALHTVLAEVGESIAEAGRYTDTWVLKLQWAAAAAERVARVEEIVLGVQEEAVDTKEKYLTSQMSLNEQYVYYADRLTEVTFGGKEFYGILLVLDGITKQMTADTEALTRATEAEAAALERAQAAKVSASARIGLQYALALRRDDLAAQIRIWETERRKHKENSDEWKKIEINLIRLRGQFAEEKLTVDKDFARKAESLQMEHLNEMRSLVMQALTPTEVTPADMAAAQAGEYIDKWDEASRQLRAIIETGIVGADWKTWLTIPEDVLAEGPERMKKWAAEELFLGLTPEQVNWEAFKQDYARFLERQQREKALIEEAMRQVGATEADIKLMFGISGELPAGAAASFKEIAETKDPITGVKDALPILQDNIDKAAKAAGALSIAKGPLDLMKGFLDDVNTKLDLFEDALEKAAKALEPSPPTEPPPPTGEEEEGEPSFQYGGTMQRGGYAIVGHGGPELAWLPGGSQITPAAATREILRSSTQISLIQQFYGPADPALVKGAAEEGIMDGLRADGVVF